MSGETKAQLEEEGILFFAERIWITVVFRNFEAKGRRYSYRRSATFGSFALTELRAVAFTLTGTVLNVSYNHPEFHSINFIVKNRKYLSAGFEVSRFNPEQKGEIELRLHLPEPEQAMDIINFKKNR